MSTSLSNTALLIKHTKCKTLIDMLIYRKFGGINIEKKYCIPRYLYKPALHCVPVLTPAATIVEKLDQRKTI